MSHQWMDVGREILFRTKNVQITEPYRDALGAKEQLGGREPYCDGVDCEIAPGRTYMVHKGNCRALYNPATDRGDGEMKPEECG